MVISAYEPRVSFAILPTHPIGETMFRFDLRLFDFDVLRLSLDLGSVTRIKDIGIELELL